jgi:hypothetical protein
MPFGGNDFLEIGLRSEEERAFELMTTADD